MTEDLSPLSLLPRAVETWIAGSVPVNRWIVTKRGRALRPDAFLVIHGDEVLAVQIEPEGPGPVRALDLLVRAMRSPLRGEPRRPARIVVADEGAAHFLGETLRPHGIEAIAGDVAEPLAARMREVERQAGGAAPLRALAEVPGMTDARLRAFFAAAGRFHRTAPWSRVSDAEPFEVSCEAWSRTTWYASVMGAAGEVVGLALHPTWRALLAIFEARDESEVPDALAVAFGDRTGIPFDDLDAVADLGLEIDGNDGYPLVFRSRPGADPTRPTLEETEILEATLLAFAAFAALDPAGATSAIVEVDTTAGRRRLTLRRR